MQAFYFVDAAQKVAEKLRSVASGRQVLCVTHLPQIAAAADHHYLIYKEVNGGRTSTGASELDDEQREKEIARMISGANGITEDAVHYASRMISASTELKRRAREQSHAEHPQQ